MSHFKMNNRRHKATLLYVKMNIFFRPSLVYVVLRGMKRRSKVFNEWWKFLCAIYWKSLKALTTADDDEKKSISLLYVHTAFLPSTFLLLLLLLFLLKEHPVLVLYSNFFFAFFCLNYIILTVYLQGRERYLSI